MTCNIQEPDHPRGLSQGSPERRPQGGAATCSRTGIADVASFGAAARVLRLRQRPLRPERPRGLLPRRQHRGGVEPRPRQRGDQRGLQDPQEARATPRSPSDTLQDLRHRDHALRPAGVRGRCRRCSTMRWRPPGSARSTSSTESAGPRSADHLLRIKYIVKNVARPPRQDGDLHAQAPLERQRLGAAPRTSRSGNGEPAPLRGIGLRRPQRDGPLCPRRDSEARPGPDGVLLSDDEQLQAARAGL